VQWGNSYSYDGFGNLTGKTVTKGTAPTLSPIVDSTTNRVRMSGDLGYDANGNWLGTPSAPNTWNVENQLVSTGTVDGAGDPLTYTYDPWGKRVLQYAASAAYGPTGTLYVYGITGQLVGTYSAAYPTQVHGGANVTFGGRMLAPLDRLGSVRYSNMAYYPWGEERTSSPDGTYKFATYFRDTFGQDYANARYYNSNLGRFWSPDPAGIQAAHAKRPISWNRYVYASDDPVNRIDPSGRDDDGTDEIGEFPTGGSGTKGDPYTGWGVDSVGHGDWANLYGAQYCFTGGAVDCTGPIVPWTPIVPTGPQAPVYESDPTGLTQAIATAKTALGKPPCASLFSPGFDPASVLDHIESGDSAYGKISWSFMDDAAVVAQVEAYQPNAVAAGGWTVNVVINASSTGGWYNTGWASYFGNYSHDQINAAVLIHELGHVFEDLFGSNTTKIKDDSASDQISWDNTKLVMKDCFGWNEPN
jgi:RHS repeat-associated protein